MPKLNIKLTPKNIAIGIIAMLALGAFLYWLFAYQLKTDKQLMGECDIFGRNKYTGLPCGMQQESRQDKAVDPCTIDFKLFRDNPRAIYNIAHQLGHDDLVFFDEKGHLVATDTHQNILRQIAERCGRGDESFYQSDRGGVTDFFAAGSQTGRGNANVFESGTQTGRDNAIFTPNDTPQSDQQGRGGAEVFG